MSPRNKKLAPERHYAPCRYNRLLKRLWARIYCREIATAIYTGAHRACARDGDMEQAKRRIRALPHFVVIYCIFITCRAYLSLSLSNRRPGRHKGAGANLLARSDRLLRLKSVNIKRRDNFIPRENVHALNSPRLCKNRNGWSLHVFLRKNPGTSWAPKNNKENNKVKDSNDIQSNIYHK